MTETKSGRRPNKAKAERQGLGRMSADERASMMERGRTTSSGQGQDASKGIAVARAAGRGVERRLSRPRLRALKVLYFINQPSPTTEQYEEAQKIGPGVVFRNARKIVLGAPLENADAVAGEVPADYAAFYPQATAGMEIDATQLPENLVSRPRPSRGGGLNPDDARPGTVDTGLAHASGTGSAQPGLLKADPSQQPLPGSERVAKSEAQQDANEWKTGKTASV